MSKFASRVKRQLGLEGDKFQGNLGADEVAVLADTDGVPVETEGSVDDELLQAQPLEDQAVEAMDEVEALDEAETALESYARQLRIAVANGEGLDETSAGILAAGLESATRRFNGTASDFMPSLESFGTSRSRIASTRASLESISDTLRQFWDWIKDQVKKAWAAVKNWFLKTLDGAVRLKKKAEALKEKASTTSGSSEKDDFEAPYLRALHIGKKKPANLKKNIADFVDLAKECLTSASIESKFEAVIDTAATIAGDAPATTAAQGKAKTDFSKLVWTAVSTAQSSVGSGVEQGGAQASSESVAAAKAKTEYFGGRTVVVTEVVEMKGASGGENISSARLSLASSKGEVDNKEDWAVLDTGAIQDICSDVIQVCDYIIDHKSLWEKHGKRSDELGNAFDKAKKAADKMRDPKKSDSADEKAGLELSRAAAKAALNTWNAVTKFRTSLIAYLLKTGSVLLSYCAKSLSMYKS